jgi:hypothetical protein
MVSHKLEVNPIETGLMPHPYVPLDYTHPGRSDAWVKWGEGLAQNASQRAVLIQGGNSINCPTMAEAVTVAHWG